MKLLARLHWLLAMAIASSGIAYPQVGLPTGEERAALVADIQGKYPAMPANVVELFADTRQSFDKETRCEVADWFADAPEGVTPGVAEQGAVWSDVCMLAVDDLTPAFAADRIGAERFSVDVDGDVMTVMARAETMPMVCCGPQVDMIRLGDSAYWARRIRLANLDRATSTVIVVEAGNPAAAAVAFNEAYVWRGPHAPAPHPEAPALQGRIEIGFIDSVALGERRRISIYLPPGWTKDTPWPAVFIGDEGHAMFMLQVESMIADGRIRPLVLIGVTAAKTESVDEEVFGAPGYADTRNSQYMPEFGATGRFDRHTAFIADEVTAWATREYNVSTRREDRAIAGFSGGGTMALFVGLRRPDVFGFAIPLSPAYSLAKASDLEPGQRASFYMSGGLYEPSFHLAAKRNGALMKAAGYDVTVEHPASGHFPDHWKLVFGNALLRFFPKE